MPATATSDLHSGRAEALGRDLSVWLQITMASISAEIRSYPTPIPRCDAQFNHLVAQRDELAQVLREVAAALEDSDAAALRRVEERFTSLPPFGESPGEQSLRARIATRLEAA